MFTQIRWGCLGKDWHPRLVRCSKRISVRTDCGSRARSRACRRARRSSSCPVPGCSERRWSAQGARCDPAPWSPEAQNHIRFTLSITLKRLQIEVEYDIHLSNDRFLAGVTASLLGGLYSLAAHVCPKRSEHMLERRGLGLTRVGAVLFLPRAFLSVHVSPAISPCAANLWNANE